MYNRTFFLFIFVQILCAFGNEKGPEISINQGKLSGTFWKTKSGRKFSAFSGIPYAKPPLGDLRFKAPVPADPWNGVLDATRVHSICTQRDIYRRSTEIEGEEDCLYLNVYTPQLPRDGSDPLPVMIFFHGGGWLCGGGNSLWYGPDFLLDKDVVLVVTNYRLGALGFLSTGDEVVPGNNGLKDQNLALRWVKDNIAEFGGNPESVTLFGESAGGASSQYHMLSPLSKGLFKNVIAQSGTAHCIWALAPKDEGIDNTKKLAEALDCPTDCTKKMVDCLRTKDPIEIVSKDTIFMSWDLDPMIPFKPVIEPDLPGAFLLEDPLEIIKSGKAADVPLIIGLNKDDGALRAAGLFGNPHLIDDFNNDFERVVPISLMYDKTSEDINGVTKKIKNFYFNNKKIDNSSVSDVVNMYTDGWFLHCTDEAVLSHKKYMKQPVYYYLFGHRGVSSFTEIFGDPHNDYGVCHADDLLYLFPIADSLFPGKKRSEDDKLVAEVMTTLWVNFASTGNPTPELNELIKEKWEPVKTEKMEYYYIDAKTRKMEDGLLLERTKFWRSLPTRPSRLTIAKDEL